MKPDQDVHHMASEDPGRDNDSPRGEGDGQQGRPNAPQPARPPRPLMSLFVLFAIIALILLWKSHK